MKKSTSIATFITSFFIPGGKLLQTILLPIMIFMIFNNLSAQVETSSELFQKIKKIDSVLFEKGFNQCMITEIIPIISDDFEFYHDKGGITDSKEDFINSIKQNICANQKEKPVRKLVEESVNVFPLYNNGNLYGAIHQGEHEFYIKEPGKAPYITNIAKFTNLWIKDNNSWKLKRVFSFDHRIPQADKTEISLSDTVMMDYVGKYMTNSGEMNISKKENGLEMNAGKMTLMIFPESDNVFFSKEAPLTFEFVKNSGGSVVKVIVREHGNIVEEANRSTN